MMNLYSGTTDPFSHRCRIVLFEKGMDFEVIDVDLHPDLEARWGEWVPVLLHGERELCHYHLDEAAVRAYLAGFPLESRA